VHRVLVIPASSATGYFAASAGRPKLVATWIAEAHTARERALALRPKPSPQDDEILQLTPADLERILDQLGDLVAALRDADPEQMLDLYRALGPQLTYQPDTRTVHAVVDLGEHRWDLVSVRGPTSTSNTRPLSPTS
jgi:site-specific DNA recombinase